MKQLLIAAGLLLSMLAGAETTCDNYFTVPSRFNLHAMTDSTRFRPVFPDLIPSSYVFEIYDPTGVKVFSTQLPEQGWNGLVNNRKGNGSDGIYRWTVTAQLTSSIVCNRSGEVLCSNMSSDVHIVGLDTTTCVASFFVPNAFTPNGDSANDEFLPQFSCPPMEYSLEIFDRWGELTFSTTDLLDGWDATDKNGRYSAAGVYVWRMQFRAYEGDKLRNYTGHVTLVR